MPRKGWGTYFKLSLLHFYAEYSIFLLHLHWHHTQRLVSYKSQAHVVFVEAKGDCFHRAKSLHQGFIPKGLD